MKLSYAPWGETPGELTSACAKAEGAGFTDVWMSELHRTSTITAAAAAMSTKTIGIGTAVALAFIRSPMLIALTALDLDELSGGRFTLGLGTGVQRLNEDWHNARFGKPAAHLRETVEIIRRVIAASHRNERIEFEGKWERIRLLGFERPFEPVREQIPIHIAAVGDVMTRLAGEIGDGWLGHELGSPRYLAERLVPNLERGLRKSGRGREDLDVITSACCVIDDDAKQAKRWAAGLVAFYASVRTYEEFFAFHGFGIQAATIRDRFRAGDDQGMIDACTDEMVDMLTLAGNVDDVRRGLAAYDGLADGVKLSPPTHLVPAGVTRHAQDAILEHLSP